MSARTSPADAVTYQGQYAGSVSRFTAYVIDLAVSTELLDYICTENEKDVSHLVGK